MRCPTCGHEEPSPTFTNVIYPFAPPAAAPAPQFILLDVPNCAIRATAMSVCAPQFSGTTITYTTRA